MYSDDLEKKIDDFSPEQLAVLKYRLETDLLLHTQFFLQLREGQPFIEGRHHPILARTLERVFSGEISRLIINMPPSYTKTEFSVIQFTSMGFALNPSARFLHVSGGKELPLDNSSKIKQQLLHPISKRLWGIETREDTRAKGHWKTNSSGGFYAAPAGGQIIGFRAGRSKPGFQGAIIIDDPQKPTDMYSEVKRQEFIKSYKSTIRSRVDNRFTPVIVTMQRLHKEDFCGWLLNGGTGEKWHHLCLPTPID